IWFTNIPSYVEWVKLPQYRLPGLTSVKREDVVVFNVPPAELNEGVNYPVDLKTNYIKRCVAIHGDTLVVKDGEIIVNSKPISKPPLMQMSYYITSNTTINERNLNNLDIGPEDYEVAMRSQGDDVIYRMWLTHDKAEELKALPYVKNVEPVKLNETYGVFP